MDQSSQILYSCNAPQCLFSVYRESLKGGCSRKFLYRIAKKREILKARIWAYFGTGRPISATTRNIFVKLTCNTAWLS